MFKKIEFDFNIGVYYAILSIVLYTMRDVLIKSYISLPSIEILFFSSILGIILIFLSLKHTSSSSICKKEYRNKARKMLVFRGVMGFLSSAAFFYCITHTTFVNTIVFMQSSALFASLFMFILFREKLSLIQIAAIFVGLVGIIMIVSPSGISVDKVSWVGLICSITGAIAFMSVRELRKYYGARTIVLAFLVANTIGSGFCIIMAYIVDIPSIDFLFQKFVMPEISLIYIYLLLIAFLNALSQIYKTKAFAVAKVGVVGVVSYLRVPMTLFVGVFLLGDDWPVSTVFIGILFVTISCVMVSYMSEDDKIDKVFRKYERSD
ncbi:MAG: EamA/RhaT family transporter, type 1 [uncultured Campylobacterales bacterium]|uniref:EamA/RhaT family transporter, type 1 n=1 Tax=uncultured Campylobacterales bacterium TaxID=352960 RepID=A0A6S6T548_9BACT|nr:MAG: EamA/RhaT family transporter, type 1 [uncultured Campylobacterales bacterium]